MKKFIILLAILLPCLAMGQMQIQAKVTTRKLPDMTIREYMYGPVKADTAYIGEKRYLLPAYEEPRHSEASVIYWTAKLMNRLNSGKRLELFDQTGRATQRVSPGSVNANVDNARELVKSLELNPWNSIFDSDGRAVYELPEGGR